MTKLRKGKMPAIVLAMMVRNERHVIRRAIESVLPVISGYLIVDTGSTDDTAQRAAEALASKSGQIVSRPWESYGHNRAELLTLAKGRGDWILLLDADEVLELGGPVPDFRVDGYELPVYEGSVVSSRPVLLRASRLWSCVGELREVVTCEEPHKLDASTWGRVVHYEDGAEAQRDQYERRMQEAEVFRAALDENPHDARAAFYAAESLRLAGDLTGAIDAYEYRAALGGREDETFWALYQIAKLHDRRARLAEDEDPTRAAVVAGMYLRAHAFRPTRAEPLVELAGLYAARGEWQTARMFAEAACALLCVKDGRHPDRFSVDVSAHDWRARHALAHSCFSLGDHRGAVDHWSTVLARIPVELRPSVERDLAVAREKLAGPPPSGPRPSRAAELAHRKKKMHRPALGQAS